MIVKSLKIEDVYQQGKQMHDLPLHSLSPRELAEVYAYTLHRWGNSVQSRAVLDEIDKLSMPEDAQTLKDEVSRLKMFGEF